MNKKNTLLIIVAFLIFVACDKKGQKMESGIITIDVTKQYPKKEALPIQHIADVEYIPLETNDEFLYDNSSRFEYIDDEIIIFNSHLSGSIFIFDRAGKALKKINRRGQSGEEYVTMLRLIYDSENKELYVQSMDKIYVYDLIGNYKRSFPQLVEKGECANFSGIYNFNKDYLLCYRDMAFYFDQNAAPFIIISKQTGEKIKDIFIPYEKFIINYAGVEEGFMISIGTPVIKNGNYFSLSETSSDTIYKLAPDLSLSPVITRKPSIQKMEIPVFLSADIETSRYHFLTGIKRELNKVTYSFPTIALLYDKQTGEISEQNFYNEDDLTKKRFSFGKDIHWIDNNQYYSSLPAYLLREAYEQGKLNGKLKEIASKVGEDDNPVLMIIKFK
jgi:hypothetical protein